MEWRIRIDDEEFTAPSTDVLKQWYAEGRVKDASCILHPILNRWMYPREIEELRTSGKRPHERPIDPWEARPSMFPMFLLGGFLFLGFLVLWPFVGTVGAAILLWAFHRTLKPETFRKVWPGLAILTAVLWIPALFETSEPSTGKTKPQISQSSQAYEPSSRPVPTASEPPVASNSRLDEFISQTVVEGKPLISSYSVDRSFGNSANIQLNPEIWWKLSHDHREDLCTQLAATDIWNRDHFLNARLFVGGTFIGRIAPDGRGGHEWRPGEY